MNSGDLEERKKDELHRIYSGALSLLGILMAAFTFLFIKYKQEAATSYGKPLLFLVLITGALVSISGISAFVSHYLLLGDRASLISRVFFFLLVLCALMPILVLIFAR